MVYFVKATLYLLNRKVRSFKCNNPHSEVYANVVETDTFTRTVTGKSFKISFNCDDKRLIYLLICNKFKKQYVGETVDNFRFR